MKQLLFRVERAMEDNPANFFILGFAVVVIFLIVVYSIYSFVTERERRRKRRGR